jgi:Na+-transporting NADH:ubiquinone oxidoreductase subunit B
MKLLRKLLDRIGPTFEKGGKLERFYPLYEVADTFFYTTDKPTYGSVHIRDAIDFKRMMMIVVIAVMPCAFVAMLNTGYQANSAMAALGHTAASPWQGIVLGWLSPLGIGIDPGSWIDNLVHGALYFIPIYAVTMLVGGLWEVLFAVVRSHEVNEGFFVTGILFPLTLPPTIPLWQVAAGITFGVVVAKELFGGTGRNFLNPALAGRAFLFFAYPAQISGESVWTAVDGFSGATPLAVVAEKGFDALAAQISWAQAFLGAMPGSLGETSALACLIGAAILIVTGIGSWRIISSMTFGALAAATLFWLVGSSSNPAFELPPHWHLVLGGFAFGTVFMATDPVSSSMTNLGQYLYGLLIGGLIILVRVVNPAFPEGTMLAILLGNVFAPLLDYFVVRANTKRRSLRHA